MTLRNKTLTAALALAAPPTTVDVDVFNTLNAETPDSRD